MKRKRMVTYLILFAMAVFLFAGGMNSQAKTEGISLNQKKLTLRVGQTERLKVRGTTRKVKWSSSNKKVAAVSKEGVVKAKKKGKAVITATAETDPTKKPGYENGNAGVAENEKIPEKLQEIPTDYYREADRQGSLVELKYETYESKTYGQKSKKLNKRAIVYLPYGYSEKERYNVFYLMHGGWSNETAWLGTPERPGTFKNVIDHAVSDGKMKPFIIVCPTYNNESPSDSSDYTLAYGTLTVNYHNELMNDLIPAVEGTYSTYADNVTPEGIKSSRDHRAFGGFSMGSVATWHTFLNCLDAFRYFMPSSGAIDSSGNSLDRAVTESGYTWKDFFIFAATGTSDFACSQFTNQIDGMLGQKSGNFREADNEAEGNLAFRIREGYSHDGRASTEYAYNGMLWFWNHGNNKQSVEKVTKDTFVRDVINNPVFGSYGRLLFPVHRNISDTLTLGNVGDILTWYHNVREEKTVEIVNTLMERAAGGETVFYDIYSDEEKRADPAKADTGLFFFKGKPGEKFAVVNAGGGFVYVGAMHDSFPVALELSKKGYNAFALIYRPGEQTACEDLARAVSFIHQNKEELGVDTADYSLWGGSAGARMAALVGAGGPAAYGGDALSRPAAVVTQYTGYSAVSANDPPTYANVGTNDGIASAQTMRNRATRLRAQGTDAEIEVFNGLSHGFGLGTGTIAEGWVDRAVSFWERQMKSPNKDGNTVRLEAHAKQAQQEITQGTSYYREFLVDNVYHSGKNGDIHYNVYFPDSYDGKKEMALYITLPGYQGLYFQGVAENIKTEDFGFEAQKYNSDMVILAPQLDDWGEKSANQTIALVEYFLSHYRIDASKVYINGYSGGGETLSLVLGKRPELFTRALMCSSQWDGEYELVVKAETPVYFVIGESDEYYSSKPFKGAYQKLYNLYRKQGLSEKQIKKLLVLDVKGSSYFQGTGITYQHGGGYLFCRDKDIMGWLFKK